MSEVWKDVVGYEGKYQCSNLGNVLSLLRSKSNRGIRKMALCMSADGYYQVGLRSVRGKKVHRVHRLIANTFIPNVLNKPYINHKNGIKTDNRIENLEWCTDSENKLHAYANGLMNREGEKHHLAKLSEKDVLDIRRKYVKNEYGYKRLAKEYSVDQKCIVKIINRENWNHI